MEEPYEYRIRKLTAHECWKLMSFSTKDFLAAKTGSVDKANELLKKYVYEDGTVDWIPMMREAESINYMSNTQLYRQAGNSICCCTLVALMGQLFPGHEDDYKRLYGGGIDDEL